MTVWVVVHRFEDSCSKIGWEDIKCICRDEDTAVAETVKLIRKELSVGKNKKLKWKRLGENLWGAGKEYEVELIEMEVI